MLNKPLIDGLTTGGPTVGQPGYTPISVAYDQVETFGANGEPITVPCMTTEWLPTIEELEALRRGGAIRLSILGNRFPPILLLVPDASETSR